MCPGFHQLIALAMLFFCASVSPGAQGPTEVDDSALQQQPDDLLAGTSPVAREWLPADSNL